MSRSLCSKPQLYHDATVLKLSTIKRFANIKSIYKQADFESKPNLLFSFPNTTGGRPKNFGGVGEWVQQKLPDSRVQIARLITDFSENRPNFGIIR